MGAIADSSGTTLDSLAAFLLHRGIHTMICDTSKFKLATIRNITALAVLTLPRVVVLLQVDLLVYTIEEMHTP